MDQSENTTAAVYAAATLLMNDKTKPELVKMARELGFHGDDARTSKNYLAIFCAHVHRGLTPPAPDAKPAMPSPDGAGPQAREESAPVPVVAVPVPVAAPVQESAPPAVQPSPFKAGQGADIGAAVALAIAGALSGLKLGVDEDAVNQIIDLRLQAIQPARIVLDGDRAPVTLSEHSHPLFEKVLRLVRSGVSVMLVGPAGAGKSYLGKQVAKALGRKFGTLHCSAGVSESQVTGWLLPVGEGGAFKFQPSHFATLYTEGDAVFLIDEIDRADANMLTVLNGALANGTLHIPQCVDRPAWARGDNMAIIAAANTFGTGADSQYVGAGQLDAATLDRFYIVYMGYDAALEHAIAGLPYTPGKAWSAAPAPTAQELAALGEWALNLRERVEAAKLRRVVSTRMIQKAIAARQAGIPADELKRDLLSGWTRDELAKVGE